MGDYMKFFNFPNSIIERETPITPLIYMHENNCLFRIKLPQSRDVFLNCGK